MVLSTGQKKQTRDFFRDIYDMPLKGGGAILDNAQFTGRYLARSVSSMITESRRNIEASGTAFVSANIFKPQRNGYYRRTDAFLWRFNHIVIDIDYLGDFANDYDALEQRLEQNIHWFSESYGIPLPTHIVFTGSGGCHLYYVFESLPNGSERKMVEGIQATKMKLAAKWVETEKNLDSLGAGYQVDIKATDASRMLRVPGSIHEDTGRMCYMKRLAPRCYTYKSLCTLIEDKPWNGTYAMQNSMRDIDRSRNGFRKKTQITFSNRNMTSAWLGTKRLNELFRLAENGWGFMNCREITAHMAWIWAKDVGLYAEECEALLRRLNTLFYEPLSERELLYTAKGNGKSYLYRNETIRFKLGLEGSDGFFAGRRVREFKDRSGKAQRHKKLIAGLVLLGRKIKEIAQELKLSVSIIKRRRTEMKKSEGFTYWAGIQINTCCQI